MVLFKNATLVVHPRDSASTTRGSSGIPQYADATPYSVEVDLQAITTAPAAVAVWGLENLESDSRVAYSDTALPCPCDVQDSGSGIWYEVVSVQPYNNVIPHFANLLKPNQGGQRFGS